MRRNVKYQNRDVVVDVIPFKVLTQDWSEYQLQDGTVIRVQHVVTEIQRYENEHSPNGDPVYGLQGHNVVVAISIPDHLRKQV